MSNNREKVLWEILDKYHLVMAILVIAILGFIYFGIGWTRLNDAIRTFLQDIIANLIPVFLLFIGSYALFRRIQTVRSEKETEELASKVADRVRSKPGALREAAKTDPAAAIVKGVLVIRSAKYGAKGHYNHVTERVSTAIAAGKAKMRVDNDVFRPDPIKGEPKEITVDYIYAGIEGYSKTVPENAYLIFRTLIEEE